MVWLGVISGLAAKTWLAQISLLTAYIRLGGTKEPPVVT